MIFRVPVDNSGFCLRNNARRDIPRFFDKLSDDVPNLDAGPYF